MHPNDRSFCRCSRRDRFRCPGHGQIAKEKASDNSADDDDDDDDDVADPNDPDDTVAAIRRTYVKISGRIPSPAWVLTHAPFNAVKSDKNGGDEIVNTVQQRALGDQLPKDIEMIVSGHVHTFEALSFADANPPQPPQLVADAGDEIGEEAKRAR